MIPESYHLPSKAPKCEENLSNGKQFIALLITYVKISLACPYLVQGTKIKMDWRTWIRLKDSPQHKDGQAA